jgi:hypothetical protein
MFWMQVLLWKKADNQIAGLSNFNQVQFIFW